MHQRAVFGDYTVHEMEFPGDATKVVEAATCYQHDGNATASRCGDGVEYRRIQPIVASDGAVVIQCEHREFHSVTECWENLRCRYLPATIAAGEGTRSVCAGVVSYCTEFGDGAGRQRCGPQTPGCS